MDQKEQIMGSDHLSIFESMIVLMKMDKPSVVPGIGGNNIVRKNLSSGLFGLRGNVAPIGNVLDSQRRLELNLVAFLLK
jgi:hypothetical protein